MDRFKAVCESALDEIVTDKKLYDLILVDEAQDFEPEFLRLCYSLLGEEKRLIYAYDELQNLSDSPMLSPEEIWGEDSEGNPIVTFSNPSQDIMLDVCYRNPGPTLTAAHALGFGIYREKMIQMFDYVELWEEIGYKPENGTIAEGKKVRLSRSKKSSPTLLSGHNSSEDLISFRSFDKRQEEYNWVIEEIIRNIREEEILPSDIVVIHPDAKIMREEVGYIRRGLFSENVNSTIAGVTHSPDEFSFDDHVTFTSIYRAKGNEAAMVYIIGADYCNAEYQLAKRRNILFTAMTRTKAWLRVSGVGSSMNALVGEFESVKRKNFVLEFTYPTSEDRNRMRIVNRDMSFAERTKVTQARKEAESLAVLLGGDVNIEDIPEDVREMLIKKLQGGGS